MRLSSHILLLEVHIPQKIFYFLLWRFLSFDPFATSYISPFLALTWKKTLFFIT
ncbi:hypothetical membrane protein [Syntrophus aciditrophicus SB]|uniref:Hypothetical membrane protein n=1 Tax=Syntrophus aciditrophicus (strain SB) TaxID=56780 RepID=Q2LQB4_SYNAS|nr:hypothetical membrane protein [Syntrophus aciditrophicus SB]